MKTIGLKILSVLLFGGLVFSVFANRAAKSDRIYVKDLDNGRSQLIVNNRPYIIKGVVYSPAPIGMTHTYNFWSDPKKPYIADAKLMKKMGVNTIRVYKLEGDPEEIKEAITFLYDKYKIRVAVGHWLGFWDNPNYADPAFREKVKQDVIEMVNTYKDTKGILCWILGNENNFSFTYGPQAVNIWTTDDIEALGDPYLKRLERAKIYYSFVNEISREIKKIDPGHVTVLANAETNDICNISPDITKDIDLLGASVYRGKSFGSFFRHVQLKFRRPVMVTEFGCDRYDAYLDKEDESSQAEFIKAEWEEIEKNTYKGSGVGNCVGGFVFEWTDEWWKYNEYSSSGWYIHDIVSSWSNGAYYFDIKAPNNFNINEEWWGICSLEKREGALDERKPTKAYFVLKELWR
ncbi:MAG: hypothetical protein ABIG92_02590 [Candidatus Omnitrophota bacterium]